MSLPRPQHLLASLLPLAFLANPAMAQTAPAPGTPPAPSSPAVVLSPIEVSADADKGYAASSALSGTPTNEKLANRPISISVFTADLMSDLALTVEY